MEPTYDYLLAKGYIKVARALLPMFHKTLLNHFGENNILIAPVKDLIRITAKLTDTRKNSKVPITPPYAAYILDYLRATVLCSSFDEMVEVLRK